MSSMPPQPVDPDATVMVPTPGRRRAAPPVAPPVFTPPGEPPRRSDAAISADLGALSGLNPLVALANPLLALVPQIRGSVTHPDPAGFRETLIQQLSAFEEAAGQRGLRPETVLVARYALCTLIDEAVSSTPWGGTAQWMRESLLVTFYRETGGGEKFFLLLNKMAEQPGANIDLLEFFYACLALGFEGRFRVIDGGRAQLEQTREKLYELIRRQRQHEEGAELSGRWKGIETKVRRLSSGMVLWLSVSACALVLASVYLTYLFSLTGRSGPVKSELAQMKVKVAMERTAPPKPVPPRLSRFLADEIAQGAVAVYEDEQVSVVTIPGDGLFPSGSAAVERRFEPVFARVAQALNSVQGPVIVAGHTDNKPIRTARFPSNWELSTERARSVLKLMAGSISDPSRLRAEGMADSDPVAPNDSEENRRKNRRVMVILRVQS